LRQLNFSTKELVDLSGKINPNEDIDLDYYPLTKVGERFPVNDPNKVNFFPFFFKIKNIKNNTI